MKSVQRHRADFKECMPHCVRFISSEVEVENRLAFSQDGMAKWNRVLIKGSIPTTHAEVLEELTHRKKSQVSSDFQSSFLKR